MPLPLSPTPYSPPPRQYVAVGLLEELDSSGSVDHFCFQVDLEPDHTSEFEAGIVEWGRCLRGTRVAGRPASQPARDFFCPPVLPVQERLYHVPLTHISASP